MIPLQPIPGLLAAFSGSEFLLQEDAVRDALRNHSMFNLLSLVDGDKVDFWILTTEAFDQSRFARRQTVAVGNLRVKVSAPEDTILVKLHWAKLAGGSEKQFKDALRVYEVQGSALDLGYLEQWAKRLDIEDLWRQIKAAGMTV